MTSDELENVAQALGASLRLTAVGEPIGPLLPAVLRLIARGTPASPKEIASATGATVEQVRTRIASMPDAETDQRGNLVGMGLTLRPTPHRFSIDGRQLYTWCALDTLMYPSLLDTSAVIESPCRATGDHIRVEADTHRVTSVQPEGAVVSIVIPTDCSAIRSSFCNEVHFFRSEEAASEWLATHPGALVLSVPDAFELGRLLNSLTLERDTLVDPPGGLDKL